MTNLQEYIRNLKEQYDLYEKSFYSNIENNIVDLFKEFFNNHPEVKFITWTQFTPYFNDGNPCEFSMYYPEFCLDDRISLDDVNGYLECIEEIEDKEGNIIYVGEDLKYYDGGIDTPKDIKIFGDLLQSLESVFKYLYGDHMQIIITPEKIETREFEHY